MKLRQLIPTTILSMVLIPAGLARAQNQPGPTFPLMTPDSWTQWEVTQVQPPIQINNLKRPRNAPRALPKISSLSLLDNIPYIPSDRNQGSCGNCWVWASTGCIENEHSVLDGVNDIQDRLSIQYFDSCSGGDACCGGNPGPIVTFYSGKGYAVPWNDPGAAFGDGGHSCPPPEPFPACSTITVTRSDAITAISQSSVGIHSGQAAAIANIKAILSAGHVIYFGFALPNQTAWNGFFDFWNNQDETTIWAGPGLCGGTWDPNTAGGHAVVLYGWDDSDGSWLLLNSWGTTAKRPNGLWRAPQALNYDCTYANGGPGIYAFGLAQFAVTFGTTSPVSDPGGPYIAECHGSLTQVPLNGSSSFQPGGGTLTYAWTTTCPGASFDDPSSATPVLSVASSSCGAVNCDVTLTVTDSGGAQDSATANVTIHDTLPPNITCPGPVTQCNDPGQCSAVVNYSLPKATDNCAGSITISCLPPPGSSFNIGDTPLNCTATDCSNNQSPCSFTVIVTDCDAPIITCPSGVTPCTDPGLCSAVVNGIDPVVSDNCPGVSLSYTLSGATTGGGSGSASGQTFNKGNTLVTYFATDSSDNTSSCSLMVAVKDCEPPQVTSSVDTTTLWPPKHDLLNVGFLAQAGDNCDGPIPAANIKVHVFSDEGELAPGSGSFSPDAKDLAATSILRLRSESSGSGDGRVYLIVAEATDSSGNTGFSTSAVTVTHDQSAKSIASVAAQAAIAQSYAASHAGNPPPGYFVIGNGPIIGPKQ